MAIAVVSSAKSVGGGNSTTDSFDSTGANFVVNGVGNGGGAASSTDSKSNTWSNGTQRNENVSPVSCRLNYVASATVGTGHTVTGSIFFAGVCAIAFSGVATSPFDQENGAANSTQATSHTGGSITPSEDNCVVVTFVVWGTAPGTVTQPTGYTMPQDGSATSGQIGVSIAYAIQTTATATNPSWTSTNSVRSAVVNASFKAAAGASTTRGMPFGHGGTAFNGGRIFQGIIGMLMPDRRLITSRNDPRWSLAA